MKKLTCLGLSVIMALSLLAGCGGSGNNTDSNTNNSTSRFLHNRTNVSKI